MKHNIDIYYNTDSLNIPNIHFHNDVEIIFIEEGSSTFLIEGKEILANSNSIVIISNLEKHSMHINTHPYNRYVVKIKGLQEINILPSEVYIKIFQNRPDNFPYVFKFNEYTSSQIRDIFDNLMKNNNESIFSKEYEKLLINQLMILIFRSDDFFYNWVNTDFEKTIFKIQEYINNNYMDDINLKLIEELFFINRYEVSRHFKRITGYNFKTYLILIRISIAKDLLVNTNLSISEITSKVGYSSETLFIRMFKKYENITPTRYRLSYKYD